MHKIRMLRAWMLALWFSLACGSALANQPLEAFYGQYIGQTTETEGGESIRRDLSVTIGPTAKRGFFVKWTTVLEKADQTLKRKAYEIKFRRSRREGIYSSAMKTNVFGGQIALDPLKGDPFVWARIKGNTLTVHTLVITEDGGYEMQVYDRTLNDKGLLLEFHRYRSGEQLRKVTAQLIRVAD
ncbi:hypothetical protein DV711_11670 [Motiliproteus coralliicola]|uniref:DUF3833 family protein n=1 Tax=Motiliproteus coralliicola TaxID=2283196 RepID=A0A369WDZ0_9GAMM|nr:hypothetical protein [Motiliproteus coralliicola]RDE19541.1 hypothetical protein DV711_11670 [Motiliproteus coralliicola]